MVLISPSMLSADFANLARDAKRAADGGADYLHYDVMDGHFVPNITVGPVVLEDLNRVTDLPLDVHLMITDPDSYIQVFREAGADIITVHAEVTTHLHRTLQAIRDMGARAGVSINPATPVGHIEEVLPFADLVLIMTVNPGFGGQKFIPESLTKIRKVRDMITSGNHNIVLEVDGGVTPDNVGSIVGAGADMVVAGSAVFGHSGDADVELNLKRLRDAGEAAEMAGDSQ